MDELKHGASAVVGFVWFRDLPTLHGLVSVWFCSASSTNQNSVDPVHGAASLDAEAKGCWACK